MNRIKKKVQKWRARKETKKQNRMAMNKYKQNMNTHRMNGERQMFSFNNNTIRKYNKTQTKKRPYNTRPSRLPPTKLNITKSNLHKDRARPKFVKELWPGSRRNIKSIKSTRHRSTYL